MRVVEDENNGVVYIEGREIDGFIDDEKICSQCSRPLIYFWDYDAYFCAPCNIWLEPRCDDKTCQYCIKRPDKPLDKSS
jgi:hypothetical protein